MSTKKLQLTAGISYLVIFFAAVFANFFVLELIKKDPLIAVEQNYMIVGLGIITFLVAAVFDVVVAWALLKLYKNNELSLLSTYFRLMHAVIMGVAVFALFVALSLTSAQEILEQVSIFNTIWLIGLFFFGIHLILLSKIVGKPKVISVFLFLAGVAYIVDTVANFVLLNYASYASIFLAMVAIPSIIGEMSFCIYLLVKGLKKS